MAEEKLNELGFVFKDEVLGETEDDSSLKDETSSSESEEEKPSDSEEDSKESDDSNNGDSDKDTEDDEKGSEKKEETEEKVEAKEEQESEETDTQYDTEEEVEEEETETEEEFSENQITVEEFFEEFEDQLKADIGIDMNDYFYFTRTDFDSEDISEANIIAEALKLNEPGITSKEIDIELREFAPLELSEEDREDSGLTEREFERLEAKFNRVVRESRRELKDFQEDLKGDYSSLIFDIGGQTETEQDDQGDKPDQSFDYTAPRAAVHKSLDGKKEEVLPVLNKKGEEIAKVTVELNDEDLASAKELIESENFLYGRYIEGDGDISFDKMAQDLVTLSNLPKFISKAYMDGIAEGAKKEVEDVNNIDYDKKDTSKKTGDMNESDGRALAAQRAND